MQEDNTMAISDTQGDHSDCEGCPACESCATCDGHGYGVEGEDWEMDDPINGPWEADEDGISPCPNCRGTGKASDMRYW